MAVVNYIDNFFRELVNSDCVNSEEYLRSPLRYLLEKMLHRIMYGEVSILTGANKSERTEKRKAYLSGTRHRILKTCMGTIELLIPKIRKGGYVPSFLTKLRQIDQSFVPFLREAYIHGISPRKLESVLSDIGIAKISKSAISQLSKEFDEEIEHFRHRPLHNNYPILIVDALYEKVRENGRVISMAIMVVCGINQDGQREIIAIEPMPEESKDTYHLLFTQLQERGLKTPKLIISDAHLGLKAAIDMLPGTSWQRCKIHFMRNILAHVTKRGKQEFADELKQIWLAPTIEIARERAQQVSMRYKKKFPKAIDCLETGLEDTLTYYAFTDIDHRKIASSNMIERLNREIRRRTKAVTVFPDTNSYVRLVGKLLMEYHKKWEAQSKHYIHEEAIKPLLDN